MRFRARFAACVGLFLLLAGCATVKVPDSHLGPRPFDGRPDSLFLSPLVPAAMGGVFKMERLPEKSHGSADDYVRVWTTFLTDYLKDSGCRLVKPLAADSTTRAGFHCPMEPADWLALYGVEPGGNSRILVLDGLEVVDLRRNWLVRTGETLGLVDDSRREYGAVVADYWVFDVARQEGGAPRRLVSRQPDDPYTTNRLDRTGKLLMRAAYDLKLDLTR